MNDKILHIVTFSLADDVDAQRIDYVKNRYLKLKDLIPGIEAAHWTSNKSNSSFGSSWQECGILLFSNLKTRDQFLVHEEHVAFSKEASNGFYKDVVVFDMPMQFKLDFTIKF